MIDFKNIIIIIKVWAIIQLFVIVLLILAFIVTYLILQYKEKIRSKSINKINELLNVIAKDPNAITESIIHFFNRHLIEFIFCFEKAEQKNQKSIYWDVVKKIISNHVLKPRISLLASSWYWFNRYLAVRCYRIGININDEDLLFKLINDKILIVSINAALAVMNDPSSRLINAIIDTYSKERQALRSTLIHILIDHPTKNDNLIVEIIVKRLHGEKNLYAKILCYDILTLLKPTSKIDQIAKNDLLHDSVELKIAILNYVLHIDIVMSKSILLNSLNDFHDEVRATAAKLLGHTDDKSIIPYLIQAMHDKAWWVRINSANALANLGDEGVIALESLSPKEDKYAYETAQAFLKIHKNRKRT